MREGIAVLIGILAYLIVGSGPYHQLGIDLESLHKYLQSRTMRLKAMETFLTDGRSHI